VADQLAKVIEYCRKATQGVLLFDGDPERLVKKCLAALERRSGETFGSG